MLNFIVDTGATTTVVSRETYTRYDLDSLDPSGAAARVVGAAGVSEGVPTIVFSRLSVPAVRATASRFEPTRFARSCSTSAR